MTKLVLTAVPGLDRYAMGPSSRRARNMDRRRRLAVFGRADGGSSAVSDAAVVTIGRGGRHRPDRLVLATTPRSELESFVEKMHESEGTPLVVIWVRSNA